MLNLTLKKISTITLLLCIFTLTECHNLLHRGSSHGHGSGGRCPPGQAKKGNC
tara:strand:- start:400 stop:558 length:159 start_codon:yes stop_codon:yes gene_type:complete